MPRFACMHVGYHPYFSLHRGRRALENRQSLDDDRIQVLEQMVKEATEAANEAERKYDEVCFLTNLQVSFGSPGCYTYSLRYFSAGFGITWCANLLCQKFWQIL